MYRGHCKTDLYWFAKEVLGYKEVCEEFHKPECEEIQKINAAVIAKRDGKPLPLVDRVRLWLWARGHFKTTIISIAHTIQLICIWPEIRILIAHNKLENAKGVLGQVKWHFTNNPKFRILFPELCPTANRDGKIEFGTTENFTVPNRNIAASEPTVDTAGVDTTKTGRHYDYIKKDDIVYEKSVTNEEQLEATRMWDARSTFLFDNAETGFQDYVGTRYHWADIYESLLKSSIKSSVIPAWNDKGEVAFKSRYTRKGLEDILNSPTMSPYDFYTQFLLQPTDPDHMEFKDEWLVYREEDILDNWYFYVCVDPAGEKKKRSDYTVMIVIGVDSKGRRHIVDGVRDKLYLHERINKLKTLIEKWKPFRVSYERVGMQADVQEINRLKKEGKFPYVTIDEIKLGAKEAKEDRERTKQGLLGVVPLSISTYGTVAREAQK